MIGHVFDGERCIHCNVNTYDDTIYGPFPCVEREPMTYTTETPPTERVRRECEHGNEFFCLLCHEPTEPDDDSDLELMDSQW